MWRNTRRFVLYSIGHRGFFLLLMGIAFLCYGFSVIDQPHVYSIYPYHMLSWVEFGWLWMAAGITSLIGAFRKVDRWSFTIASIVSAGWAIRWFYVASQLPKEHLWSTGITWTVITGIILIVSTWPEVHVRYVKDDPCLPDEVKQNE